ncbi:patatin-like phospholipase family protein [Photobacterium sanguinicancri]|uniref:Phospholipase n=1 Tax=Photobacterium sanguinicancri TaxID=875932 RepID=A0ABX4FS93_9GAMM|nr:patatin-like phospholipase family protein [Photobacterium sanguinicancri]OZS41719.1 phospholipase [Photobacterium sanguinicancri]
MKDNTIRQQVRIIACALLLTASSTGWAAEREKVGLVLSGGGAKGAAHIGVLEVLEENRIPVDIITGTSMGAYVGGMYAMGLTAQEVKNKTLAANWQSGYVDRATRNELVLRRKQQNDNFQLHTDFGVTPKGEFRVKPGAFQGQGMAILLRGLTNNFPVLSTFDNLVIPYRSVATDIAKVKPVVIDSGHLATAMQASMTVPGALTPIEWEGHRLVDGGVVNNMPVDVAQKMGADVIIAVDLRDPLLEDEDLGNALTIISQLTTFMTNSSADHQKALMSEDDIYLQPILTFMTAPDFDKMTHAYEAGRKVAIDALPKLLPHQLSATEYAQYVRGKQDRRSQMVARMAYYIDSIELENKTSRSDKALLILLDLDIQRVVTNQELEIAVNRLNAQDIFSRISYEIKQQDDETVLVVDVTEKSWGPGYLNFKFAFEDDFSQRSDFTFGAQYLYTNLTDKGGEWLFEAELGSWKAFKTEIYLPLDYDQRYFSSMALEFNSQLRGFKPEQLDTGFDLDPNISTVDGLYQRSIISAEIGINLARWSAISLGYMGQTGDITLSAFGLTEDFKSNGPYTKFDYDNLDNQYFPTSGLQASAYFAVMETESQFENNKTESEVFVYNLSLIKPYNIDRHTFVALGKFAGADSKEFLPIFAQDLGGLFNLSGYHKYELNGRYSALGALIYRYQLLDNDFGAFSTPVYVGGSLEKGGVWNEYGQISVNSMITASSVFVGVDSVLGPVYLAYGMAEGGESSLYLTLGSVFQK